MEECGTWGRVGWLVFKLQTWKWVDLVFFGKRFIRRARNYEKWFNVSFTNLPLKQLSDDLIVLVQLSRKQAETPSVFG